MHHVNARGITRQKRRLFHRRIAAAHNHQDLVAKRRQRAIAGRAR